MLARALSCGMVCEPESSEGERIMQQDGARCPKPWAPWARVPSSE